MTLKERRERERRELRQGIMEAARGIAADEGWQAVTIRKVAEQVEYSPPMIYEYFASKEDLLLALMRESFHLLGEILENAAATVDKPKARLLRMARAYWDFALTRPERYQVMHGLGGVPFASVDTPPEVRAVYTTLRDAVRDAGPRVWESERALNNAVDIFWATLHGLVSRRLAGGIMGDQGRGAALVEEATRDLLSAWRGDKK